MSGAGETVSRMIEGYAAYREPNIVEGDVLPGDAVMA